MLSLQDCGCPAQRFPRLLLLGDPRCLQPPAVPRSVAWPGQVLHLMCGGGAACKGLTLRWSVLSRAGQLSRGPCVQQQRQGGLPPDPHCALCTPETHHSSEGSCRAPRDREPRPHSEGERGSVSGTGVTERRAWWLGVRERLWEGFPGQSVIWKNRDRHLMPIPPGVPSGGLVLPLHTAGPLGGHHSCVHRPGEGAGGCWKAAWATAGA